MVIPEFLAAESEDTLAQKSIIFPAPLLPQPFIFVTAQAHLAVVAKNVKTNKDIGDLRHSLPDADRLLMASHVAENLVHKAEVGTLQDVEERLDVRVQMALV